MESAFLLFMMISFELLLLLISALGTDHPEVLPIEDDDIVTKGMTESDVVTAIKLELFPCQQLNDSLEIFRRLIGFLL